MAINIAILGFGTVGSGVAETLDVNKDVIAKRIGQEINVRFSDKTASATVTGIRESEIG